MVLLELQESASVVKGLTEVGSLHWDLAVLAVLVGAEVQRGLPVQDLRHCLFHSVVRAMRLRHKDGVVQLGAPFPHCVLHILDQVEGHKWGQGLVVDGLRLEGGFAKRSEAV